MPTTLILNGERRTVSAPDAMPLLWALRDVLDLTGTKFGCGRGLCGACTVLLDGVATRSCTTPLGSAAERAVTTIEGLSPDGGHPVQRAWVEVDVPQCGYCQAGQIMTAAGLLSADPEPDQAAVERAMAGILCRCGTYPRIRAAVQRASELAREEGA